MVDAKATSEYSPDAGPDAVGGGWAGIRERIGALGEALESEWSAVSHALTGPGREPVRKWLGWALYRVAARVNPEIRDSDS